MTQQEWEAEQRAKHDPNNRGAIRFGSAPAGTFQKLEVEECNLRIDGHDFANYTLAEADMPIEDDRYCTDVPPPNSPRQLSGEFDIPF